MIAPAIAPVKRSIRVRADQRHAFKVFARGMGRWWLRSHSINRSPIADVILEPRAGGRWFECGEDGSECEWGKVLAWEPPERLLLAWQIDAQWRFNPDLLTEVEVRFIAEGPDATRVELEHRKLEAFAEHADRIRATFDSAGGWPGLLESFAKSVATPAGGPSA